MRRLFPFLIIILLLSSCSEYQKILKSEDIKEKYDAAEKFYNEGDFKRALRLFEQIAPKYVGKPQGERVMYFLADSYYKEKDYATASYQFERFIKSYNTSDKVAEAAFLGAKSTYMLSPRYSLDQSDTDKALAKLQLFINSYTDSEYFAEANIMAQELTQKKEKKAFEVAKQFHKLGTFDLTFLTPSITAFDNFLSDFPGSVYREEALFYKLDSASMLALNSFDVLKKDRVATAKKYYENLKKQFPETQFDDKAKDILDSLAIDLQATAANTNNSK